MIAAIHNLGCGPDDKPLDPFKYCPHAGDRRRLAPPPSEEDKRFLREMFPEHTSVPKGETR